MLPNFTPPMPMIDDHVIIAKLMKQLNLTQPQKSPLQRKSSRMPIVMWAILGAFLLVSLVTAYVTFLVVREWMLERNPPGQVPELLVQPTKPVVEVAQINQSAPLQEVGGLVPDAWDGAGRVNVLMMGLDYRDWEDGNGAARTDTMILFTLNPINRTAGFLSIPRDLWVSIPGFEYGKINTAYYLGEIYNLPGGGPALAVETVEQLFGVNINYYAQVDFTAFEVFIDEIGGLQIEIPEEITVDPIGPGNTVTLSSGAQILNGATALAYARNRDTLGGDFDRSQRQQQVILAIRRQVLDLQMLPTLIQKSPVLYQQLSSGVHTNLSLDEIIRLAWLAQQIPAENIRRGAIGPDQVTFAWSPDGLDILQPDPDAIRNLRDEVFSDESSIGPVAVSQNPQDLVTEENASLSVLNATTTVGLAAETSEYLLSKGLRVFVTGNANEVAYTTAIIDYTGKPYTVQYLVDLMSIRSDRIYRSYSPDSEVDIAILVGEDWAQNNPMP